jgi:prepilin peptidase CpaA
MNISNPSGPLVVTAVLLLVAATVTDIRSRRIPNFLTFPAIAAGLAIRSFSEGWTGLLLGVAGGVLSPVILMLLRMFRRLGMGDLKLAVAVGVLLGPAAGGLAMLVSTVAGGLLALAVMLRPGTAGARLLSPFFVGIPVLQRVYPASAPGEAELPAGMTPIPYGVAIAVGTLLTLGGLRWS